MRLIDADELIETLDNAINMMAAVAENFGLVDDPEIEMELKAYRDIRNGVSQMPTIKPERKTGKWLGDVCSECGSERAWYGSQPDYCPDCGSYNRGEQDEIN